MYLVIQSIQDYGKKIVDIVYHELPIGGLASAHTPRPQSLSALQHIIKGMPDQSDKALQSILTYPANLYYSVRDNIT